MRSNRRGLPKEVKEVEGREVYSTETWWEKEDEHISLTSYVTKTSKGKRNIAVLSTVPPILGTEKDTGRKTPAIIVAYNFRKGIFYSIVQSIVYSIVYIECVWHYLKLSQQLISCFLPFS